MDDKPSMIDILKKSIQEGSTKEEEYLISNIKCICCNKDINAFCLTVDKNGHDYLKTMTQDMGYEVLDDVKDLPERLLDLYRNLTM